jgi:high-affinity nickel permease
MSFDWLYQPLEHADAWLSGGLDGAGWPVVLLLAALLGLRHATDPDHLAAVTTLVAGDEAGPRQAGRLGAAWGVGHATVLVGVGAPLILLGARLPAWLESAAERLVGLLIIALAVRVLVRWWRRPATGAHAPAGARSAQQSVAIGALHGLGGTGAIVLLLLTALPSATTALFALALFAPMSAASMALCTALYGRLLATPRIARAQARVGMPALAATGILFGGWYAGLV